MKIVVLDAKTLGDDLDISALVDIGDVIVHQTTKTEETSLLIQHLSQYLVERKLFLCSK